MPHSIVRPTSARDAASRPARLAWPAAAAIILVGSLGLWAVLLVFLFRWL